jgi:hypothetical protein
MPYQTMHRHLWAFPPFALGTRRALVLQTDDFTPSDKAAKNELARRGSRRGGGRGARYYEFPTTLAARSSRIFMRLRPRRCKIEFRRRSIGLPGVTSWSAVNGNLHLGSARPGLCTGDVVVLVAPFNDSQAVGLEKSFRGSPAMACPVFPHDMCDGASR